MKKILHLKKRRDFVRVAEGIRMVVSTVILQAAPSLSKEFIPYKIGFTATKKIGKACVRNRTRRRLRAVAREIFPDRALANVEYVLIGRFNTANCPFERLKSDVKWALKKANSMILDGVKTSPLPTEKESGEGEA